ncbi:hypothetical protein J3R03_003089 [Actinoplanes couchii]|nr:transposase [Actinoplanes couchii]MDR6318893.1 hypothetical protein [Actinoplanes couchii]
MIDLLPGRDAAPLTAWLHDHESPMVICRDRASAYAEAAKTAAPDAVQVADRFHLWQNLATAIDRLARRHRTCLTEQPTADTGNDAEAVPEPTGTTAQRRRRHHALVHELIAQGAGFRQIARHLGWSHNTVSRYAHAATWQELMTTHKRRPSLLDPFKPYLTPESTTAVSRPSRCTASHRPGYSPAGTASSEPSSNSTASGPIGQFRIGHRVARHGEWAIGAGKPARSTSTAVRWRVTPRYSAISAAAVTSFIDADRRPWRTSWKHMRSRPVIRQSRCRGP